jgi:CRP/FNR family transcriptional regulator, cyclic AMP receptor protein
LANNIKQVSFDPKGFLAKVGEGKTILEFRKDQVVFARETPPTRFFIFKKAGSRLLSYRSKAKKPSSEF